MKTGYKRFKPPHLGNPHTSYGDRPTKWWIFWNRQKKHIRALLIFPLITFIAVGSGWTSFSYLPSHTRSYFLSYIHKINPFIIHKITIEGASLTDKNSIYLSLGTTIGDPFFGFSIEEVRKNILDLPFVENCTIERIWPDKIAIYLTERNPIAIWQNKGHFILINAKGETISSHEISLEKDAHIFSKLPLIVGEDANKSAYALLDMLHHYPEIQEKINAFIRIGQRRWNIILKNKTLIMLPEGAEASALAHLQSYQDMFQLLDRPIPIIDMRLPDRMVIHLITPTEPLHPVTPLTHH